MGGSVCPLFAVVRTPLVSLLCSTATYIRSYVGSKVILASTNWVSILSLCFTPSKGLIGDGKCACRLRRRVVHLRSLSPADGLCHPMHFQDDVGPRPIPVVGPTPLGEASVPWLLPRPFLSPPFPRPMFRPIEAFMHRVNPVSRGEDRDPKTSEQGRSCAVWHVGWRKEWRTWDGKTR